MRSRRLFVVANLAMLASLTPTVFSSAALRSGRDVDACGQWEVIPSPRVGSSVELRAVSAIGPDDAWAVGSFTSGTHYQTLAEHWDGTLWEVVETPTFPAQTFLYDVDSSSSSDVWAVGVHARGAGGIGGLVEHWDGTSWARVPVPHVGGQGVDNYLNAVSARSPDDVWIVGTLIFGDQVPLILHWDGLSWSEVPTPSVPHYTGLTDVSAVGPDDVWAVGIVQVPQFGSAKPVVEHWDGLAWTVVRSARLRGLGLTAVSAAGTAVWAAGLVPPGYRAFTERWDGLSWEIERPVWVSHDTEPTGIEAITSDDVWFVGSYFDDQQGARLTLAEHWDGASWTPILPESPSHSNDVLNAVSSSSSDDVWTVGTTSDQGTYWGLVEHYCPTVG